MHKKIATNTTYQAIAKIVSAFSGFLVTILIARAFGVLGYGDFIKITAYVGLFYLFVDFGLNAIFLQLNKKDSFKDLFYTRLLITFIVFLICNSLTIFLPFNQALGTGFSPSDRLAIFIFSFSLFNQAILLSSSSIFQKKLAYQFYMGSLLIGSVLNLFLIALFIYLNLPLVFIIFSFVLTGIITSIVSLYWTKEKLLPFKLDLKFSKKLLIASWPIGLMLVFNLVYFRSDMLILSLLKPSKDVGVYGLSFKFFDFLIALPLFLSNSLYPMLLESKKNTRKYLSLVRLYLLVFGLLGIVLILPFWFFSPVFTIIKSDFSLAIVPFRILLISLPLFFVSSFLQWIIISLKEQKYLMYAYLFSTVFNVVLNLIFIPIGSYIAAAIITGVSEGLVVLLLSFKLISVKILLEQDKESYV